MQVRRRLIVTFVIWLVASLVYGLLTVASKLALPPTGDAYAHTVSFQVLSFLALKGPALVCVLVVSLLSQVFLARIPQRLIQPYAKRVLLGTFWLLVGLTVVGLVWASGRPIAAYNPYFKPGEQQVLQFMISWLPLFGVAGAVLLMLEFQWLKRRAR